MAKSGFVVINATHNIGHGKFVLLVSSLFVLIVLQVVAAMHIRCGTHGWPK